MSSNFGKFFVGILETAAAMGEAVEKANREERLRLERLATETVTRKIKYLSNAQLNDIIYDRIPESEPKPSPTAPTKETEALRQIDECYKQIDANTKRQSKSSYGVDYYSCYDMRADNEKIEERIKFLKTLL